MSKGKEKAMIILIKENVEKIVTGEEAAKAKEAEGFHRLSADPEERLDDLTKQELLNLAKSRGLKVSSKSKKADVMEMLK